jgi:hypothetical protein
LSVRTYNSIIFLPYTTSIRICLFGFWFNDTELSDKFFQKMTTSKWVKADDTFVRIVLYALILLRLTISTVVREKDTWYQPVFSLNWVTRFFSKKANQLCNVKNLVTRWTIFLWSSSFRTSVNFRSQSEHLTPFLGTLSGAPEFLKQPESARRGLKSYIAKIAYHLC